MLQSRLVAEAVRPTTSALPQIGRLVAARPRLEARLDRAARSSRLVVVEGEAGSGKTTLVTTWVGRLSNRAGVRWHSLRNGATLDDLVSELAAVPPGPTSPRVVVLDDLSPAADDAADAGLEQVLQLLGPRACLVVLSTASPALDLRRLGAGADCQAIDPEALAMDTEEITGVLARLGVEVTHTSATAIRDRTFGWAWGVRLAAARLVDGLPLAAALRETELSIADYLENSILRDLSADERRLLTRTSMVAEVSAEHARTVLGKSRPLTADIVERTHGFIRLRADGSFRTHPLLRELLLSQLRRNPATARTATRQAAQAALERGDLTDAVDIAAGGADWDWAAHTLISELRVPRLLIAGSHQPRQPEVIDGLGAADPLLKAALALGRCWPDVAARALQDVEADVDTASTGVRLSGELAAMALARWQGDVETGLQCQRRAAALLPELNVTQRRGVPELIPLLDGHLAAFELANGAPDRARVALERAARAFRPKPAPEINAATQIAAADCLGQLAWIEAVNGELTSALHRAAAVLTARPADSNEVGVVYAQLASVWCEISRSGLEQAQQRFDSVSARRGTSLDAALLPELAVATGLTAARLAGTVGYGRLSPEVRQLCRSSAYARRFEQQLQLIRVEAELEAGEPAAALRLLAESNQLGADAHALRARAWIQLGDRASVAASLRVRPVEPLSLLTQVQLELVEGWLAETHGNQAHLRSVVDRALRTAAREQLRTPIAWAKPWLHEVITADPVLLRRYGSFLASVRSTDLEPPTRSAPIAGPLPLVSPLTEREIDILQRLGALSTNEEIAADLYLSPNTIKTHLRSLYRKLDVTRRSDAFRRGRALGLC